MKSSPIYNKVHIPGRSSRNFGAGAEGFTQRILVGSSATNSNAFATFKVREIPVIGQKDWFTFNLYIDGVLAKGALFNNKTKAFHKLPLDIDALALIKQLSFIKGLEA